MTQEQILRMQGWSDENINKLRVIANHPEAYQYALKTNDLTGAYGMTQPKEKEPSHNLMDFFGSFSNENPDTAKELSIALTKFARWVQSEVDKGKTPN